MSPHTSPKPALESLQRRLKSLHKRRYNLDADFLSIHQDVNVTIEQHRLTSARVSQCLRWMLDHINYFVQYYYAYATWLQPQGIDEEIVEGMYDLGVMETEMCRKMKTLGELREISEFERESDRGVRLIDLGSRSRD